MRKLPIKTSELKLDGEWEGWDCTVRTNPPISVFADIASGDFDRIARGIAKIITKWNFVDEDGTPMANPSLETVNELPVELITVVANSYVGELTKLPPA
jgi:hypothetical protein